MVDLVEIECKLAAKRILDVLFSSPGIDVVPARADDFLKRLAPTYRFYQIGKGKSRYTYAITKAEFDTPVGDTVKIKQYAELGLVLKLGGKAQNNREVANTKKYPDDFPKIYGAFDYAIVAERAEMIDEYDDPRCKDEAIAARLKMFAKRYGDIRDNIGFIGERLVIVDGGVPLRS